MATEERKTSDYLKLPEITAEDFSKHMAEDDFLLRYGNPVVIHGDDKRDLICMAWEYYERLCRQIDALESELESMHEDANIKYWIYEFEMPEKTRQEFEAICALHELTTDEFFQAAVLDAIRKAEADPEGYKQSCMEAQESAESDIRLVRYYPVYKGETEAQAYKRKLAEEDAENQGIDAQRSEITKHDNAGSGDDT